MRHYSIIAALTAGLASAGVASAAVWDFQSDAVGAAPTTGVVFGDPQAGTQAAVVDAGSTPADPFGGTGNRSFWLEDSSQTNTTWTFGVGAGNGFAQGTFSTKIYLSDDLQSSADYQSFDVNGGTGAANTGASDIGPWLQYNSEAFPFRAITSSGVVYFDNAVPHNTAIDLVIDFDATTRTFTGTLNGNALTSDGGATTTFNFFNTDLIALESVRIVHASSVQTAAISTTFYDDVTLVPEPSVAALMGIGLLALGGRRSRRA